MRKNFRIGPGAASLMLVIVVVALSLLALLSLIEAHGNHKLAEKSINYAVSEYNASANAQRRLAELDAVLAECSQTAADDSAYLAAVMENLPEGMSMTGNIVTWEEATPNGRVLVCKVRVEELGSSERYAWQEHMFENVAEEF